MNRVQPGGSQGARPLAGKVTDGVRREAGGFAEGSDAPAVAAGGAPRGRLDSRRVLVVGGGTRAGQAGPASNGSAVCALAAAEGAAVAVADIDPEAARRTAAQLGAEAGGDDRPAAGNIAVDIAGDAADPAQCERIVDETIGRLGGLDGVVVNVGISEGLGLAATSAEMWDRVFAVNVRAHFLVAKFSLPRMDGGAMVFIGSLAGHRPGTFSPSYDSSKAALSGLCRHVALEGTPRGIRVNLVSPGLIDTPMGRDASRRNPLRDRVRIPLGRQGTAQEVAEAVVFLLSDQASYITGQDLLVDGGLGSLIAFPRDSR